MNAEKIAKENTIWSVVSGSRAYGTSTKDSDEDIRGLFIAPKEVYLSPYFHIDQVLSNTNDEQNYELKKFFKLLTDCNPNILEILSVPKRCIRFKNPIMDKLLAVKDRFLSKKARFTFSGYAIAQLKRIKGHNKWLMNPMPEKPPSLRNYVRIIGHDGIERSGTSTVIALMRTTHATKINEHNYKLWVSDAFDPQKLGMLPGESDTVPRYVDIDLKRLEELKPEFVGVAQIDIEHYKQDMKRWNDYWSWVKNRNEKRSTLEAEHGYDTKHAMHLVRLLRMGKEILSGQGIIVDRPDAAELLSIRNGAWTYEQILEYAESMDKEMESIYKTSKLPSEVDINWANDLFIRIVERHWDTKAAEDYEAFPPKGKFR